MDNMNLQEIMKKEHQGIKEKVIKEMVYQLGIYLFSLLAFAIVFYREHFFLVIKTVTALYWLFIFPGFFIMYYWVENIGFIERFAISFGVTTSAMYIFMYYLGLAGMHIKYFALFPLLMIALGIMSILKTSHQEEKTKLSP